MERNASQPKSLATGEISLSAVSSAQEANPTERESFCRVNLDTQVAQCRESGRHQAFPARFVDRRFRAVSDNNVQAPPAGSNCTRKPSRAATDDEHVRVLDHPLPSKFRFSRSWRSALLGQATDARNCHSSILWTAGLVCRPAINNLSNRCLRFAGFKNERCAWLP